jgi:hypothetical protein
VDRLRIIVGYTVTAVWAIVFTAGTFDVAPHAPVAEVTAVMVPIAGYLFWKGGNGAAKGS